MSLENLLGISLERVDADPLLIKRLLEAAHRNLRDAERLSGLLSTGGCEENTPK